MQLSWQALTFLVNTAVLAQEARSPYLPAFLQVLWVVVVAMAPRQHGSRMMKKISMSLKTAETLVLGDLTYQAGTGVADPRPPAPCCLPT